LLRCRKAAVYPERLQGSRRARKGGIEITVEITVRNYGEKLR
jgi:hypothetical protein